MSDHPIDESRDSEPEQLNAQRQIIELAQQQTLLSAERCYQNAERTLSVWVRTALGLMIFGIAIDRFGLILHRLPNTPGQKMIYPEYLSNICSIALVGLGVVAALISSTRFYLYARAYAQSYPIPYWHQPSLASFFALLVAGFGLFLFFIMLFYISF